VNVDIDIHSNSVEGGEIYKRKEKKPVLVLLSDLYSELDKISVDASRALASLTLHYLLTTYFTHDYSN